MSKPFRVSIVIEGEARLRKKLRNTDALIGKPWTDALTEAAKLVQRRAQDAAPIRTGALRAAVKYKVQNRPVPLWARVTANKQQRGFRYGWALNFSQRRAYHYRRGPHAGKLTLGWFTNVITASRNEINALLRRAASQIESRWGAN